MRLPLCISGGIGSYLIAIRYRAIGPTISLKRGRSKGHSRSTAISVSHMMAVVGISEILRRGFMALIRITFRLSAASTVSWCNGLIRLVVWYFSRGSGVYSATYWVGRQAVMAGGITFATSGGYAVCLIPLSVSPVRD